MAGIDGDDTSAGSIEIGLEPEDGTIVIYKYVLGVEIIEQLYYRGISLSEVFVIETVLGRRVLRDADNQIMAVICNVAGEQHFFVIRAVVDQFVF